MHGWIRQRFELVVGRAVDVIDTHCDRAVLIESLAQVSAGDGENERVGHADVRLLMWAREDRPFDRPVGDEQRSLEVSIPVGDSHGIVAETQACDEPEQRSLVRRTEHAADIFPVQGYSYTVEWDERRHFNPDQGILAADG